MVYELYIDVLFLVNFMMDYLLLRLVKRMLKCTATHGSICLGAALGSLLTCVIVVIPIPHIVIKFILFHGVINTIMIRIGLKIKDIRNFAKAFVVLYIGAFLLGGVMESLSQYVRAGSLFFAIAIVGYYAVSKIWDFIASLHRINQYHCEVELFLGDKSCLVKGMIDTGNGLCDPVTNQPVSILDGEVLRRCFGGETPSQIRYIPYHSIGKRDGILLAMRIDRMRISGEKEIWISKPLIGVSEEPISAKGGYEMILNPNLL